MQKTNLQEILTLKAMKPPRLVQDIQAQAASLAAVLQHQCGKGRPAALDAASLLRPGKRVLIAGIGASVYASIPFENFLCSHGIDAVVVEAAVQFATLRLAQLKGVPAGSFRYAPPVTRDEAKFALRK
jgi:DNA-binding MurR/RpiR family transcriptional regulator